MTRNEMEWHNWSRLKHTNLLLSIVSLMLGSWVGFAFYGVACLLFMFAEVKTKSDILAERDEGGN